MAVVRHLPRLTVLWVASSLAGCTNVGPDFERPLVPWLADWSGGEWRPLADTAPRRGAEDAEWWHVFGDTTLDALVAEALQLNLEVRTAGARIMEARAELGIAGSGRYPQFYQLTGEALYTYSDRNTDSSDGLLADLTGDRSNSEGLALVGYDLAWEIDFWGKFRRGIESADAAYFASVAQYDDVQVLVAAETARLYAAIRTIELRLAIAHENATIQRRSLEITERLFRSGNDSELDVQQARTQYLATLATIPELESGMRQARNALGVLLARPPGDLPELDSGQAEIPEASLEVIVDLPAELLRRRPDVRTAELQLAAQSAQIGVSRAALYPSISLVGSLGLSVASFSSPTRVFDALGGPALVWNVFDFGRLRNQVLVQDARFQALYEQFEDVVLRAARELDDAATAFAHSRTQVDILRDSVQAARRALDIATLQYREGLVDFQRVLDSQQALFNQQDRLVTSEGDVAQDLIAVYKAMGGGWEAARMRPVLDDETEAAMRKRSRWRKLLDEPLPPPATEPLPPLPPDSP